MSVRSQHVRNGASAVGGVRGIVRPKAGNEDFITVRQRDRRKGKKERQKESRGKFARIINVLKVFVFLLVRMFMIMPITNISGTHVNKVGVPVLPPTFVPVPVWILELFGKKSRWDV